MKKYLLLLILFFSSVMSHAQNVGIGTTAPNANAALEIKANNKGILMPRTSSVSRNAMTNVAKGMMVYDTTYSAFYYHDGNKWRTFSEKNTDSLVKDFSASPEVTGNMPPYGNNFTTSANSGLLYDNGGPSGNYSNNAFDLYGVLTNDSTVGYKVIVEQYNLENLDSLIAVVADDQEHPVILNATGTYYFPGTSHLVFLFSSNATVAQAGFRIRWTRIVATKDPSVTTPPFGWHFDNSRLAARGGIPANNNWASDSLGKFSFAFGNHAAATGLNSFSFGQNTAATAKNSFSFGFRNTASGENSFSFGQETTAEGSNAFAAGFKAKALGSYSVVLGNNSVSTYDEGVVIGQSCSVENQGAIAIGRGAKGRGWSSLAIGMDAITTNINSTSVGYRTEASGPQSAAFGSFASVSGPYATAIGDSVSAEGSLSAAFGHKARTTGTRTTAVGSNVTARSFASTALGYFNNPINTSNTGSWVATDPLLIVGNGTGSTTTSNAMMILKNGNTGVGINTPSTKFHIDGGTDASFSSNSGYLVIGDVAGTNVVFDNNEIMARNNGVATTLFLQNSGGGFEVGGSAAKPGGGSWSATSDARLKQQVTSYTDGLQQLLQINPVQYHYNNLSGYDTSKNHIGVIAQELQPVAPYMVNSFKKDGEDYLKVDNSAMTYMLINAVKEQQQMINQQQQQIDELKKLLQQKSTGDK